MLKPTIIGLLNDALKSLDIDDVEIEIEKPADSHHGDYSTNVAMKLARVLRKAPLTIAKDIADNLPLTDGIQRVEVAPPGFINFYLDSRVYHSVVHDINRLGEAYACLDVGRGQHVNIEFVSANPTGHLHIGHARGAAAGDAMARIMRKAGYRVTTEFYVNDGGNQINTLARSIDARYQQLFGRDVPMPEDGYHGSEIKHIAERVKAELGDRFLHEDGYEYFKERGVRELLDGLKRDLEAFGVSFDVWYHETTLYESNAIDKTLAILREKDYIYEKDGAHWLKTSDLGDEKDRVIIKSDGTYTYLLPDIAYHHDKLARGYTYLIDILGGDHHGYVPRLKAAIKMISGKDNMLDVDILQMVKVMQDGKELTQSKRSGKAITLADLITEVGKDPIRYFFAMRSLNTHMELDLDLALRQTNENPVYYAQYAHARIASVLREAGARGIELNTTIREFTALGGEKADALLAVLADYPHVVRDAAEKRLMHRIPQYIHKLASALHSYYADTKVLTDNLDTTAERLAFMHAVKVVLKDALTLVGVDAIERM